MANIGFFDAQQVAPQEDFGPVPTGEYVAMIIDSQMKATKQNTGHYLELTHQILEGPLKGRKVWARLNLQNKNATAVQIANQQLSSICHAAGILQVNDSSELHNKPMIIRVEYVKADGIRSQRDSNEIKAWKATGGAVASASIVQQAQPSPFPPPSQENQVPVWARPAA